MSKELLAFFQIFFTTINEIYENKTNMLLRNTELGITRMLYSDILSEIVNILKKESNNDSSIFHNNIFNSFQSLQNNLTITPYMTNAINMVNCISPKSKEIISRYLDIILEDKFIKDDDINRTHLYLRKLQILVLSRWRKSENNEYNSMIKTKNNRLIFDSKYSDQVQVGNFIKTLSGFNEILRVTRYVDSPKLDPDTKKVISFNDFSSKLVVEFQDDYARVDLGSDESFNVYSTPDLKVGVFSFLELSTLSKIPFKEYLI
jgi:hypothetical protein